MSSVARTCVAVHPIVSATEIPGMSRIAHCGRRRSEARRGAYKQICRSEMDHCMKTTVGS